MTRQLGAGDAALELVEAGAHVGDEPLRWRVAERRVRVALARQARGAALLGEQVDRQRAVAVGGEPRRDRADVRRQPPVLVDDEDSALGRVGRRVDADEVALGPGKVISSASGVGAVEAGAVSVGGSVDAGRCGASGARRRARLPPPPR